MTMQTETETEDAGDVMERLVGEAHADLETIFLEDLSKNPDRNVVGVLLSLRARTHIYVLDESKIEELLVKLNPRGEFSDDEFWVAFSRELSEVFSVPLSPGRERLLVGQPHTGYVARLRFASRARMQVRVSRVCRDWHCPPGPIATASHCEIFAMNMAHASAVLAAPEVNWSLEDKASYAAVLYDVQQRTPKFDKIDALVDAWQTTNNDTELMPFLREWRKNSFARLEIGHKLAASLSLTDVPDDIEIRAPWGAWSLVIPDGLLLQEPARQSTLSRLWILGTRPVFGVYSAGGMRMFPKEFPSSSPMEVLLNSLVRGACLALSNPEDFAKKHHGSNGYSSKSQRQGPPNLQQARYMLSAPVKIDLRQEVHAICLGTKRIGGAPKVQFLVRGHWRNQVHGPSNTLRKTIWVEPFWKGPEESRILLRQHRVDEPDDDDDDKDE